MDPLKVIEHEACANYNTWYAILMSVVFWSTCYFMVQKIFNQKSPEWCSRVVTLIHGCGSTVNGLSECATNNLFVSWNVPQSEKQQIILLVSLGYFIFDLLWCLYYQTESKVMVIHHVLSTVGLFRLLQKNYAGAQTCCGVGGMEITNPLLQLRWFIRNNETHKKLFVYADILFVICFLIMRCGFGSYFFANVVLFHDYEREYMVYVTVLYLISWLFVLNILQYLFVKYWMKSDSSKSAVNPTVNTAANTAVQTVMHPTVNATS